MKVVVGLGNPGPRYEGTRHNVGFRVLGELGRRHGAGGAKTRFEAEVVEASIAGHNTLLVAPQTYMNLSGRSVRKVVDFYDLSFDDLLVVSDDINLDTGRLRLRAAGSAGGQKGLADIINRLGTQDFPRLRIGVGRPPGRMDPADYVLSRFKKDELEAVEHAHATAADAVETWIRDGVEAAMNRYNAPPPDTTEAE